VCDALRSTFSLEGMGPTAGVDAVPRLEQRVREHRQRRDVVPHDLPSHPRLPRSESRRAPHVIWKWHAADDAGAEYGFGRGPGPLAET
jgi:hypothetical protein